MSWQVQQYLEENPGIPPIKAVEHFAKEMQVIQQVNYLLEEVDKVLSIRKRLRPLYGQKSDIEGTMSILNSKFDMRIAVEFPTGKKGNAAQRKSRKIEMQESSESYQDSLKELQDIKEQIEVLEEEIYEIESRAKNARKIVDTFNTYAAFIHQYAANKESVSKYVDNTEAF